MNRSQGISRWMVAAVAVGLIAYPVFAMYYGDNTASEGKKIAVLLDQNKLTLAKAVAAAEQHSKGRAISVISALNESGKLALEVYCIAGDPLKIMKCSVEGTAGTVTDMREVSELPMSPDALSKGPGKGVAPITDRTLEVGCGSCTYSMAGVKGCKLAIKFEGKAYLVEGAKVTADDVGLCSKTPKQAVVTGRIEGDKFVVSKFEMKP